MKHTMTMLSAVWIALICGPSAADIHYADVNNAAPSVPYTSWATASTNIQDAVDVAVDGDTVMVASGHYPLDSEIGVANNIILLGIDTPIIDGQGSVRCFNLGSSACTVSGFTVQYGWAASFSGPDDFSGGGIYCENQVPVVSNCYIRYSNAYYGGGISGGTVIDSFIMSNGGNLLWVERGGGMHQSLAINCIIAFNHAFEDFAKGGGMYGGTAVNCTISYNWSHSFGGGMAYGTAIDCTIENNEIAGASGSGTALYYCTASNSVIRNHDSGDISNSTMHNGTAYDCIFSGNRSVIGSTLSYGTAYNCVFTNNRGDYGGGMYRGTAHNCVFVGNEAYWGGGTYGGTANNCTVYGNYAWGEGGGMYGGTANNCIIWGNGIYDTSAPVSNENVAGTTVSYSCSPDMIHGMDGNITNSPIFVDGTSADLYLASASPCINAGFNGFVSVPADADGLPRIVDGTVDMGAYEYGFNECLISGCTPSDSEILVEWTAFPMWQATVQYSTNLIMMPFTDCSDPIPYPVCSYAGSLHGDSRECFYRIELQP